MARAGVRRALEKPETMGNRAHGGRRADLGERYFRSSYEANYARYLNWSKVPWEYETKTFWFEGIKRGSRSYTPDFWIIPEAEFHEVKGWMDPKSATKLKRMKKYHPAVKVVIIGGDWFKSAERQKLCSLIPGWECKHTRSL
jgi:hypothetical protein